ncbi:MAG: hypothetical protein FWC97_00250 [Treponema sp.]|nr:hypothetical protein [Treponema sp.]
MRSYCKHCKSEITSNTNWRHGEDCPICRHERDYVKSLVTPPDYETSAQYEKRTGKKLSDLAAVWIRIKNISAEPDFWLLDTLFEAKKFLAEEFDLGRAIVVAYTPEPPPGEWEPSEG